MVMLYWFGMRYRLSFWKILLFLFLALILFLIGAFIRQTWIYYDAIRTGKTNPMLEQELQASFSQAVANTRVTAEDLARLTTSSAGTLGKKTGASLTIVEFVDFGCPFSQYSATPVRKVMQKYKDQVSFYIRDFPIDDLHPNATQAALAARCAARQNRYWLYHDKLFANQGKFTQADLETYAQDVGLDTASFRTCLLNKTQAQSVQQDQADGLQAGVGATPTFFFNGIKVQGGLDEAALEYLIQRFLKL